MSLGRGSYGEVVVRNGLAVKKFSKLSHLIQEHMALYYLRDCEHIVNGHGANFPAKELSMQLYDCSLKIWLENAHAESGPATEDILTIVRDILLGLVEIHDKNMAHGDLKPGNILIRKHPLKAVLGDCGFVSVAKYAKVDRTAAVYRDPVIHHDSTHDMYSLGICLLEMLGKVRIGRQVTYEILQDIINTKITDKKTKKIIYNLVHADHLRRPTARELLKYMFNIDPARPSDTDHSVRLTSGFRHSKHCKDIKEIMKINGKKHKICRTKKGYGALLTYLCFHEIAVEKYDLYTGVTLMILSAIMGVRRSYKRRKFCEYYVGNRKESFLMIIGHGTYGTVIENDASSCRKLFRFSKAKSLISEAFALRSLSVISGITEMISIDCVSDESYWASILMKRYRCTVKEWLYTVPNLDQRMYIYKEIVKIMTQVHNLQFVHADLKLENIMLDDDGNVKIIDWGLSGPCGHAKINFTTRAYRPQKPVHHYCHDVYSLGVLGVEFLLGAVLTSVPHYKALVALIRRTNIEGYHEFQQILIKMIDPSCDKRPTLTMISSLLGIVVPTHEEIQNAILECDVDMLKKYRLPNSPIPIIFNNYLKSYPDNMNIVSIIYSTIYYEVMSCTLHRSDIVHIINFFR